MAQPEILDSYNAERHPVAEAIVKETDQGLHTLISPNNFTEFALKVLGSSAIHAETVQSRLRTTLAEINIAYKDSPIVEDYGGSSGPAAGERAPDATVSKLPDKTVRLFEVLQGNTMDAVAPQRT